MTSEGPNNPGTVVNDSSYGTVSWSTPTNAESSDNAYASVSVAAEAYESPIDSSVVIVKADGSLGSENKSSGASWSSTEGYVSFGGSTDLWSETWTAANINDSDFGVAIAVEGEYNATKSQYLKATNFGFSIPTDSTIVGVVAEFERMKLDSISPQALIDHVRITIYYTEGVAGTTIKGVQSITGVETIQW